MAIVKQFNTNYNKRMIIYDPFWQTMKAKGESTYTLIHKHGISSGTIDRMRKGEGITTQKLDDLCKILHCKVEDIILFVDSSDSNP